MKNGAAYIRVSTDRQEDYSPEAQLDDIKYYCKQHNIYLDSENIFVDVLSGTNDKRANFQRMLSKAKAKPKPFDVIIVHKFDRFARNREDSIVHKSMLRKKLNIDVESVKEQLPEDRKLAMMMEGQLELWAEYYSMNLSDEVKKGLRKKADKGEHIGKPPFGYIKKDKQLIIKEDEADIVRYMFKRYNEISLLKLVQEVNSFGIKTKNGGLFNERSVRDILNNPIYIGHVRWTEGAMGRNWNHPDTMVRKSTHEPIISKELWDKVQAILKEKKEIYAKYAKPQPKHLHWLRGLLICSNCGKKLVKSNKHFQCSGYNKGQCKISHYITVKKIAVAILEQIKKDYTNRNVEINISNRNTDNASEIDIINKQLKQIAEKEKRVKLAYENAVDTLEEYKANKTRLQQEKLELESKLESLNEKKSEVKKREEVFNRCANAYKILTDITVSDDDKYTVIHHLIDKIVFVKAEKQLLIYYK